MGGYGSPWMKKEKMKWKKWKDILKFLCQNVFSHKMMKYHIHILRAETEWGTILSSSSFLSLQKYEHIIYVLLENSSSSKKRETLDYFLEIYIKHKYF